MVRSSGKSDGDSSLRCASWSSTGAAWSRILAIAVSEAVRRPRVLVGQAAEIDLQRADVGHRGERHPGLEPRVGRLGRGQERGDRLAILERRDGRDRAVPHRHVRVRQQRTDRPADIGTGAVRSADSRATTATALGCSLASTIATRASTAAARTAGCGALSVPSSAGTAAGSSNRPSAAITRAWRSAVRRLLAPSIRANVFTAFSVPIVSTASSAASRTGSGRARVAERGDQHVERVAIAASLPSARAIARRTSASFSPANCDRIVVRES